MALVVEIAPEVFTSDSEQVVVAPTFKQPIYRDGRLVDQALGGTFNHNLLPLRVTLSFGKLSSEKVDVNIVDHVLETYTETQEATVAVPYQEIIERTVPVSVLETVTTKNENGQEEVWFKLGSVTYVKQVSQVRTRLEQVTREITRSRHVPQVTSRTSMAMQLLTPQQLSQFSEIRDSNAKRIETVMRRFDRFEKRTVEKLTYDANGIPRKIIDQETIRIPDYKSETVEGNIKLMLDYSSLVTDKVPMTITTADVKLVSGKPWLVDSETTTDLDQLYPVVFFQNQFDHDIGAKLFFPNAIAQILSTTAIPLPIAPLDEFDGETEAPPTR